MAQVRNVSPGYVVIHPNRDKAICKLTKLIVVGLMIASVVLMVILTVGGWSKLQGMKPVNFIWSAVYLVIAYYILRWSRGLLPIAAALAVLLLIIAVISGFGLAGTSWFDRNHHGFGAAQSVRRQRTQRLRHDRPAHPGLDGSWCSRGSARLSWNVSSRVPRTRRDAAARSRSRGPSATRQLRPQTSTQGDHLGDEI